MNIGELIRVARDGSASRLIARSSWPGGTADQTRPAALGWVRRWRPRHPASASELPACGCPTGRCDVCN